MCRKLFLLALVLGFASISYGYAIQIGNWEGGNLDGWVAAWEGSPVLATSTKGTSTGTGALEVTGVSSGYWVLQWNCPTDILNTIKYNNGLAGETLKFDLTMYAADWPSGQWTMVADKIAVNSNVTQTGKTDGFVEWDAEPAAINRFSALSTSLDWGPWSGDVSKTYILDIGSYEVTSATEWLQIVISVQGGEDVGAFYFDDARLVPEPTTIAMLGLGGLALIRRKR